MALRPPRGAGVTAVRPRQTNRPTYEDFQPQTETNEEEGARIVVIHVPGFLKEQMRITSEQENIRVQGQRPLGNNRWSRFSKLLQVPQKCDVNKIHAKYTNGILTITMPKEVAKTALATPKEEKPAEKATQENINKSVPPKAGESKVVPPPSSEPNQKAVAAAEQRAQKRQEQTKDARHVNAEEKVEKGQRRTPQTITSTADHKHDVEPKRKNGGEEETRAKQRDQIGDEKRVVGLADSQKYTSEPKSRRVQEETSLKQRDDETQRGANGRLKESEKAEQVKATSLEKEEEDTLKGKESVQASAEVSSVSRNLGDRKKDVGKFVSSAAGEETPKEKDKLETSTNGNKRGVKHVVEAAKQTVTNVARRLKDDDRQMLINIGAAVLVIVAIGAYVSHRLSSSAKRQS